MSAAVVATSEVRRRGRSAVGVALLAVLAAAAVYLRANGRGPSSAAGQVGPPDPSWVVVDTLYQGGFKGRWADWGWAPRELDEGKPARVDMRRHGGWILGTHASVRPPSALRFEVSAPEPVEDFLEVRLRSKSGPEPEAVALERRHLVKRSGGWTEVTVRMQELAPAQQAFDQVVLRARGRLGGDGWVSIDRVVLLGPPGTQLAPAVEAAPARPAVALEGGPSRQAELQVQCRAPGHRINPMIYGIAYSPRTARQDGHVWALKPGGRRWGGNPASRFNWRLDHAWNTGSDWFFRNLNYTDDPRFSWRAFLTESRYRGVPVALTVPLLGWVAKDTASYAFPVSVFGPQASTEPGHPDVGNGVRPTGEPLTPGPAERTSVRSTPADVGAWVAEIRAMDAQATARHVQLYLLGNEPMLWHLTHRDVRGTPVGYDTLLERTLAYGDAVRAADPGATIAGPGVWGWPAYFFSAQDQAAGFRLKPDRRAHGDIPLLEWYLSQVRAHEEKTGVRLLDLLDVHFYPQADGIYASGGGKTDPASADLRIRSTRALWDPSYRDESWINEVVQLLPRLKKLVDKNAPGVGLCLGEYSFGGDHHISGAVALAEALGRFGQFEGLEAAFYWTYPPAGSPTFHAFKAFRDYDGKGARFGDWSLPTSSDEQVSLFASRDPQSGRIVAVVVNRDPVLAVEASVALDQCGVMPARRGFRYDSSAEDLQPLPEAAIAAEPGKLEVLLPPWSITVLELAPATG